MILIGILAGISSFGSGALPLPPMFFMALKLNKEYIKGFLQSFLKLF